MAFTISLTISAVLAVILGIAVLLFPKLSRWALGIWLIVYGIMQLIAQY